MSGAAAQHKLRLVGIEEDRAEWLRQEHAKLSVVKENRIAAASGLDPGDPRWILAMQTQARLQGASLSPEKRDQLLRTGHKLGLRPFESNLVIAVVQDRARCGQGLGEAGATLSLIPHNDAQGQSVRKASLVWPRWFAAIAAAMAVAAVMVRLLAS